MKDYTVIGLIVVALLLAGGLVLGSPAGLSGGDVNVNVESSENPQLGNPQLGAQSGPEHYNEQYFYNDATFEGDTRIQGPVLVGASTTLTAADTTSITAAQACDKGIVNFDPTATTAGSTTLPGSADVISDCLTTAGDSTSFLFRNLSSGTTTQIVAGAASTLVEPDGQNVIIDASSWAFIRLFNLDGTNLWASVDESVDAD